MDQSCLRHPGSNALRFPSEEPNSGQALLAVVHGQLKPPPQRRDIAFSGQPLARISIGFVGDDRLAGGDVQLMKRTSICLWFAP